MDGHVASGRWETMKLANMSMSVSKRQGDSQIQINVGIPGMSWVATTTVDGYLRSLNVGEYSMWSQLTYVQQYLRLVSRRRPWRDALQEHPGPQQRCLCQL